MKKVEDNIENMVVPCWIYQNDHGIPHDVCDYYVKKHENKKFTLGKTGTFEKQEKVDKNEFPELFYLFKSRLIVTEAILK